MTEILEIVQANEAPPASSLEQDEKEEGKEPELSHEQSADSLNARGSAISDQTGAGCFHVERHTIAQPTYSIPAIARLHVLTEVIGNPSGVVDCQWKLPDVVAESVNALEQRLLKTGDAEDRDLNENEEQPTSMLLTYCVLNILIDDIAAHAQ